MTVTTNTELLFLEDGYLQEFEATVVGVDGDRIALDRTSYYVGGGGQPADRGVIYLADGHVERRVDGVELSAGVVWHRLSEATEVPVGSRARGQLDWAFRYAMMRTHSAAHTLQGIVWNRYKVHVTGFKITEPYRFRTDFEFDSVPEDFKESIEDLVNAEIKRDRRILVSFLSGDEVDESLIRTKENLIPTGVKRIRVVEIEGLDRQYDGGTHVHSTAEIGEIRVGSFRSKGRSNKRMSVEVVDRG